LTRQK